MPNLTLTTSRRRLRPFREDDFPAVRALTDFGFAEMGLHRVHAYVVCANAASVRVLEKLGMRCEGHLREAIRKWDQWHDLYLYAVLDREWAGGDHAQPRP